MKRNLTKQSSNNSSNWPKAMLSALKRERMCTFLSLSSTLLALESGFIFKYESDAVAKTTSTQARHFTHTVCWTSTKSSSGVIGHLFFQVGFDLMRQNTFLAFQWIILVSFTWLCL